MKGAFPQDTSKSTWSKSSRAFERTGDLSNDIQLFFSYDLVQLANISFDFLLCFLASFALGRSMLVSYCESVIAIDFMFASHILR